LLDVWLPPDAQAQSSKVIAHIEARIETSP
jgi:hypothetical protein